jgi:hypothetical protein
MLAAKCHGPETEHVAHPTRANIVNSETLDFVREMTSVSSVIARVGL